MNDELLTVPYFLRREYGPVNSLTFGAVRVANTDRCVRFGHDAWRPSQWSNATAGEAGELAEVVLALAVTKYTGRLANTLKKLDRQMPGDPDIATLREQAAKELADIVLYADLTAAELNIDLGEAVRAKFNEVSDRHGFPERL